MAGAEERGVRRRSLTSFLIFLDSSRFTFLSAIKPVCIEAVQCVTSVPTFQICSYLRISARCFLKISGYSSLAIFRQHVL